MDPNKLLIFAATLALDAIRMEVGTRKASEFPQLAQAAMTLKSALDAIEELEHKNSLDAVSQNKTGLKDLFDPVFGKE